MAVLSDIDWFEWKGRKSTTYGITVLTQPTYVKASERMETVTVPGREGSLTILEGEHVYDDINLNATCVLDKDPLELINVNGFPSGSGRPRISVITEWLSGADKVTFANRQEGYYMARIANQIPFDKVLPNHQHLLFQVQFRCKPFLRLHSGEVPIIATTSPFNITNQGNIPSRPLLEVTAIETGGSIGNITVGANTLSVNFGQISPFYVRPKNYPVGPGTGGHLLLASFFNESTLTPITSIMLDCDAKMAYSGILGNKKPPTPRGMRVTGDWIRFPTPGSFTIQFTQPKITQIKITPRWLANY